MKVLRADQYATVPWRNGGGTTREIAIHKDASLHDDFLWRLSIATVARSGSFSSFGGVDRTIALLDGEGMSLRSVDDCVLLTHATAPFSFEGETEIACELVSGETIDLNVMTRRGYYDHHMHRERLLGWMPIVGKAEKTFVVANASLELSWHGRANLRPMDTVADIARGTAFELYADQAAEIFIIELTPRKQIQHDALS